MTVDRYIAYIRDVRRYSPRTQELYRKALEDFGLEAKDSSLRSE